MPYRSWVASLLLGVLGYCENFSIVVLPDTQYYSKYPENAPLFSKQTQWIKDQVENKGNPHNIVFVSHLGDVVNDGHMVEQWTRANASMSALGPPGGPFTVPFGILPGNHDFFLTGKKALNAKNYLSYFGPKRFSGAKWYGGADSSGLNSFQLFSGGGFHFLHIALEWRPNENTPERDKSPLEWAAEVLHAHPSMPVIISTHEYITDDPPGRSAAGDAVFNNLVKSHDQIFMVLSGHCHYAEPGWRNAAYRNDGEWYQISTNHFGHSVIEVLQDFQDYPNGGNGWLRLITFDTHSGKLHFQTYSPVLDEYQQDSVEDVGQRASDFTISLDLTARLSQRTSKPLTPFGHRHGFLPKTAPHSKSNLRAPVHK